ncbi:MAG: chemotaxis protein CheX [Thermotogaceae bacterium]|jgi:chemotaxis protein CheX|nr:chemotaxis protein CheX [Thermotogaceae bacterium]MDN5338706.1 chemotaxis protein CheX [Thermotogaceae bacterium]
MDAKIVNSILNAVNNVFEAIMSVKIKFGKPEAMKNISPNYSVVGIIGFTGKVSGNLVYSFKEQTVFEIIKAMIGMELNELDEMALSAVGELANMISGNIAINLEKAGYKIEISPPSVVKGREISVKMEGVVIRIPAELKNHEFDVSIAVQEKEKG